jgi:hypothetical protein
MSVPVGGGFVELIAAPAGSALTANAAWTYSSLAGFLAANPAWATVGTSSINLAAGIFSGGGFTIANVAPGANASYVVLGWTGGAGTTWDTALASGAMLGESAVFTTATANPGTTPPGVAVNLKTTFGGITLAPIPEPATFALAGLGLAALMVFRRRS